MANRSKAKGTRGEVEILDLLQGVVNEEYAKRGLPGPELSRAPHGRDIVGLPWLAPEVKRVEQNNPANVASWWKQCKEQGQGKRECVLFYRQNNRPWEVRMFGFLESASPGAVCFKCKGIGGVLRPSFSEAGPAEVPVSCDVCRGSGTIKTQPLRVRCPVDVSMEAFLAYLRIRIQQDLDVPVARL